MLRGCPTIQWRAWFEISPLAPNQDGLGRFVAIRKTDRGFKTVYGHARPGGSKALNARFGAVFLDTFPDWYGTGEEYCLYHLALE